MATVVMVEGTGSRSSRPDGLGLLSAVADKLDRGIDRVSVDYPGAYGWPISYHDSLIRGTATALGAIDRAPGPVYLVGYSQGAVIAGHCADHSKVERTYLISDPHRPRRRYIGNVDPGGYGLAGEVFRAGLMIHYFAASDDPITSAPPDSILRSVADFTRFMSPDLGTWLASIDRTIREQAWQNVQRRPLSALDEWRRVREAGRELSRYPRRHIDPYIREHIPGTSLTPCEWIAASINELVRTSR
ncbi:alpha/beta hydrolase [Nocardia sp. CS682]|uniref:alpha/beta hydrolase n=1 Tax=Nocardia sp. CS682 TaxID=1047172 RepID=UPI001432130D|nr:alpha/beta hydrolase [Nocardia sp. CS682]